MCLIIYFNKHKVDENNQYMPKIAKTDILVYKMLYKYSNYDYETPFQGTGIRFWDGIFIYPQTDIKIRWREYDTIDAGIHTYSNKKFAKSVTDSENSFYGTYRYELFKAIIPKGSEYFIGISNDIVSNNLIVFETEKAYNEYAETHEISNRK